MVVLFMSFSYKKCAEPPFFYFECCPDATIKARQAMPAVP